MDTIIAQTGNPACEVMALHLGQETTAMTLLKNELALRPKPAISWRMRKSLLSVKIYQSRCLFEPMENKGQSGEPTLEKSTAMLSLAPRSWPSMPHRSPI
jgi:hypothetical protein